MTTATTTTDTTITKTLVEIRRNTAAQGDQAPSLTPIGTLAFGAVFAGIGQQYQTEFLAAVRRAQELR